MRFKYIFVLIALFTVDKIEAQSQTEPIKISIDPQKVLDNVNLSSIISNLDFTLLETNEEYPLGEVSDIFVSENNIFILDEKIANAVFCYHTNGKLQFAIQAKGRGPGEFYRPTAIAFDRYDQTLHVMDRFLKKIVVFNLFGKFIREIELDFSVYDFKVLDQDTYAMFLMEPGVFRGESYNERLLITNKAGIIKFTKFNYSYTTKPFFRVPPTLNKHFGNVNANDISFVYFDSRCIYSLNPERVTQKYVIDFGKYNLPKNQIMRGKKDFDLALQSYALLLNDFVETTNIIHFTYFYGGLIGHYVFINKKSNQVLQSKNITDDINGFNLKPPIGTMGDEMIYILNPLEIQASLKNKSFVSTWPEKNFELRKIAQGLNENSNYVLMFCKLSDF